ncbi:hypothetical protein ES703_21772 [subsurface metagenome]
MEINDDWYRGIVKEVALYKDKLSTRDYRKYKLDLLLGISKRVVEYSSDCEECLKYRGEITNLAENLGDLQSSEEKRLNHNYKIESFSRQHLQKSHGLITAGKNTKRWGIIGLIFGSLFLGTCLGAAGQPMAISNGALLGVVIGVAIGIAMDLIAKKRGRVI